MVVFPTAYDTTATTITFLLYNLALHPEIQQKVYEEILTVVRDEVKYHRAHIYSNFAPPLHFKKILYATKVSLYGIVVVKYTIIYIFTS